MGQLKVGDLVQTSLVGTRDWVPSADGGRHAGIVAPIAEAIPAADVYKVRLGWYEAAELTPVLVNQPFAVILVPTEGDPHKLLQASIMGPSRGGNISAAILPRMERAQGATDWTLCRHTDTTKDSNHCAVVLWWNGTLVEAVYSSLQRAAADMYTVHLPKEDTGRFIDIRQTTEPIDLPEAVNLGRNAVLGGIMDRVVVLVFNRLGHLVEW